MLHLTYSIDIVALSYYRNNVMVIVRAVVELGLVKPLKCALLVLDCSLSLFISMLSPLIKTFAK